MADNGEKTEKPTAKRRQDERKEGNVFQSKEVGTVFSLLVVFYSFKLLYSLTESTVIKYITDIFTSISDTNTLGISESQKLFTDALLVFAISAMPILIIAGIAAILPVIVQTRALVSFKSIRPKFSHINPINGIKKMFSLKGIIELLKSIIKIAVLIYAVYTVIKDEMPSMYKMIDMSVSEICTYTGNLIMDILETLIIVFAFVAGFDYMYQRWEYEKNLRMTKQEIKEEYKNTEGDPQIKGRIKQKQRESANRRMMQAVPEANVVIRNPTHYAVALKYEHGVNSAPIVVAKGKDSIALKIIEIAEKHNVVVVENRPLARALYADVKLDSEIPSTYYQAVAEVIAFVYKVKKKELK